MLNTPKYTWGVQDLAKARALLLLVKELEDSKFNIIEISNFSYDNLRKELNNVEAIALRMAELPREILQECKSLKIVSRHGVGYDNVDLNYLNKEKIALAITGTANAVTVAEHVMAMFLNLCKLSKTSDQLVRSGQFDSKASMQKDMLELYKRNIFIIGFGRIGKTLAKRCIAFESNIFVYDPYIESNTIKAHNCTPVSFDEGIKIADFVSLHLPINEKTKYLISKKFLMILSIIEPFCLLSHLQINENVNEKPLDLHLHLNLIGLYNLCLYLLICLISLLLLKFLLITQQFLYRMLWH